MPLSKKQESARARAIRKVQEYEEEKLALQAKMREVAASARSQIAALLVEWGRAATETDRELAKWENVFGYESTGLERSLELSPFISDGDIDDDFADSLDNPELVDEVLSDLLAGEPDPFLSEPGDWTLRGAIEAIEGTEPWQEPEE